MEVRKIEKDGKVMKTSEGKELLEYRFSIGDEFVPQFNKVLVRTKTVQHKGKEKQITNYSLKCKVRDKNGQDINNGEAVFVTLTPAQAKSLQKKETEGIELNQHVFTAYKYTSENYGDQIGVGFKQKNKPPVEFPKE